MLDTGCTRSSWALAAPATRCPRVWKQQKVFKANTAGLSAELSVGTLQNPAPTFSWYTHIIWSRGKHVPPGAPQERAELNGLSLVPHHPSAAALLALTP